MSWKLPAIASMVEREASAKQELVSAVKTFDKVVKDRLERTNDWIREYENEIGKFKPRKIQIGGAGDYFEIDGREGAIISLREDMNNFLRFRSDDKTMVICEQVDLPRRVTCTDGTRIYNPFDDKDVIDKPTLLACFGKPETCDVPSLVSAIDYLSRAVDAFNEFQGTVLSLGAERSDRAREAGKMARALERTLPGT